MGGAQAGEVASRIAAESLESAERGSEAPEAYLRSIAESANRRIHEHAAEDDSRSGMGTTFTAALIEGDEISLAHVGDSRAYLFRDGELRLLTSDHSLVEELRRQGKLTPEQAEDHPQRSIITRALGPEREVEVDTVTYRAKPGDVFLLCSDGLTTMIKDDRIAAALVHSDNLEEAARRLIREANTAGGRDNITVVLFRVAAEGAEAPVAEGATLVGPTAADAGLSGVAVREEAERVRKARERDGRRSRRGAAPAARQALARADGAEGPGRAAGRGRARGRSLLRRPPGLLPRQRRRRPGGAVPRPSLRPAAGDRALHRGRAQLDRAQHAAEGRPADRDRPRAALLRRRPRPAGRLGKGGG